MADDLFDQLGIPQGETGAAPLMAPSLSPDQLGLPAPMTQALTQQPQVHPAAPPQVINDPRQRLAMLASLGFMLGAGPRSGAGAGAAHGLQSAQQILQHTLDASFAQHNAEVDKQNALLAEQQRKAADEERQRQANLLGALKTIRDTTSKLDSKDQYDTLITGAANTLQTAGYRLDANWLRQAVPFVAPSAEQRASKALTAFLKNPANQSLIKEHPEELSKVMLTFDRDGDGVDEKVPITLAAQIAKQPFAVDEHGTLITYPKGTTEENKANADGIFQDKLAQAKAEGKDLSNPKLRQQLREEAIKAAEALKPKTEPTVVVQTTDDQGNAVTKIVKKTPGTEYKSKPNAVTENRLASAKAVNQTGTDIINEIEQNKAILGPLMSRYASAADFFGAPPPQFSYLKGQIESFALANMGVHGMRSNGGAQDIKDTIGLGRHTPESLIKTIQGLMGFSSHLLNNAGQSDVTPSAPPSNGLPSYQDYLRSKGATK